MEKLYLLYEIERLEGVVVREKVVWDMKKTFTWMLMLQ